MPDVSLPSAVVIEDDPVHAGHLRRAVDGIDGIVVDDVVATCAAALALIGSRRRGPALAVVDLHLPDGSGLEIVRAARTAWPATAVLVTSVLSDEGHVVSALRDGARGYVLKDASTEQLQEAVRQVLRGHAPLSPAIARHLIRQLHNHQHPPDGDAPRLTPRERALLDQLAVGRSYAEAAERLGVTSSTIETHVRNLYRKLAVHSKTQAIARARTWGIL
jgi:DNA-binding NarL/FixJ family response regulator